MENSCYTDGMLRWVLKCNTCNLANYLPFGCVDVRLGWVPRKLLHWFEEDPEVFVVNSNSVNLHPRLTTPAMRTKAVAEVLEKWRIQDRVQGWRGEQYRASSRFDLAPQLLIERAAATLFGICSYGVHLNGYVLFENEKLMWLARRANDRPQFPGFLDHIVAGGLTAGMSPQSVLTRECMEEAGIPESLACEAKPAGFVGVFMEYEGRIKRDLLFCYDLELPRTFAPCNHDGEVESFVLTPIDEEQRLISETDEIKLNCNLVMIDFLVRHGYVRPEDTHYTEIVSGLRGSWVA